MKSSLDVKSQCKRAHKKPRIYQKNKNYGIPCVLQAENNTYEWVENQKFLNLISTKQLLSITITFYNKYNIAIQWRI